MSIYESNDALKIISMPREGSIQCVVKQAFSVVWLQFMCSKCCRTKEDKKGMHIQTIISYGLMCLDSEIKKICILFFF